MVLSWGDACKTYLDKILIVQKRALFHTLINFTKCLQKKPRLDMQKNAFSRVGAKIWNETPNSLKNISKKTLKLLQIHEPRTWVKCLFFSKFLVIQKHEKTRSFPEQLQWFSLHRFPFRLDKWKKHAWLSLPLTLRVPPSLPKRLYGRRDRKRTGFDDEITLTVH